METVLPPHQLEFFLKRLLNYILKAHISYDKAFRTIIHKYSFPRWALRIFYKVGYYTINYYYSLRWLSAKNGYGTKPAGIINYFSKIGFSIRRARSLIKDEVKQLSRTKRISLLHSYPEFLVKDLLNHMSEKELDKMLKNLNVRKRWLRINTLKISYEDAYNCLDETGIIYQKKDFPKYMVYVEHPKWDPIGHNKCVKNGFIIPQDLASAYVVEALELEEDKYFLDACSAPGLKYSLAFMLTNNKLYGFAIDLSSKRISIEQTLLKRLGVDSIRTILINADSRNIKLSRVFDYALVDAPCSGLGAVYSDPAVKLNTNRRSKLEQYHKKQYRILKNILRYARRVVYATCSIHPLEGEKVIERIVNEGLAETVKINLPGLSTAYKGFNISNSTYRVLPHTMNSQGFYIAVLESKVAGK